tara:strand:- start:46437 stop:47177 length:741 start_codon:yes stop_codon:yes gene_type:complete
MSNFDLEKQESTLFIDIGNTALKVGFKSDGKWKLNTYKTTEEAAKQVINHPYPVRRIILSSVRETIKDAFEKEVESHLIHEILIKDIDKTTLEYQTPETLGIDRYLGCFGAQIHTNKAVVVIDAGSACTIDYMDEDGVFKGGVIMPGLTSILNIFEKTAPQLPKIKLKFPKHFPGKSTTESLELGQIVFFIDGISKMLERFTSLYGDYDLFLNGGDAESVNELIGFKGQVNKKLLFDGMEKMIKLR